jgi:hypothetical protein
MLNVEVQNWLKKEGCTLSMLPVAYRKDKRNDTPLDKATRRWRSEEMKK